MSTFDLLILFGALFALAGFFGLILCIIRVMRARRAGLSDEELRGVLQQVVPLNFGALAISVIGLMLIIIGIALS